MAQVASANRAHKKRATKLATVAGKCSGPKDPEPGTAGASRKENEGWVLSGSSRQLEHLPWVRGGDETIEIYPRDVANLFLAKSAI